jgi:hypothetical protein
MFRIRSIVLKFYRNPLILYIPKPQPRFLHTSTAAIMPLVAPGINSFNSGEVVPQHQEWANVLMGKTIGEKNSVTVSRMHSSAFAAEAISDLPSQTFAKSDLPENARIIKPGQSMTQDFREDR